MGSPVRIGSRTIAPSTALAGSTPPIMSVAGHRRGDALGALGALGRAAPLVMKAALTASVGQGCQVTSPPVRRAPIARSCLATRTWVMGLPATGAAAATGAAGLP
jgi:hypothetical protein